DEKQQSGELRDLKWRFGLCRSHGLQGGHFVKELRNQHENIQIQGDYCGDHVDATPGTGKLAGVAAIEREGEKHDRDDTDDDARCDFVERKEKTGDAGGKCCPEEKRCPGVE